MRIFAEIDRAMGSPFRVPCKTLASRIQWDKLHKEHLPILSTEAVCKDLLASNEDFLLYNDKDFLRFANQYEGDPETILWMLNNGRVKAYSSEDCSKGIPIPGRSCQGNFSFVGEYNYNGNYPMFGLVTTGDLDRLASKVKTSFEIMDQYFGTKTFGIMIGPFFKQSPFRKKYGEEMPWELSQDPIKYCSRGLRNLGNKFRQRLHFVDSGRFAKPVSITLNEVLNQYEVSKNGN